jgi:hypothetical protein
LQGDFTPPADDQMAVHIQVGQCPQQPYAVAGAGGTADRDDDAHRGPVAGAMVIRALA